MKLRSIWVRSVRCSVKDTTRSVFTEKDGMGDCDIIHPKRSPEVKRAVEFILEQVEHYPNEVELIALGPATNIALAILTDREIMSKVKHIWSMGTPGFSFGNATPVSEFNVFIDAEACFDAGSWYSGDDCRI